MECDNATEIDIFNKLYHNEVIGYTLLTFNIVFGTWCTSASVFILTLMYKGGITRTESVFVVNISVCDLIVGLAFSIIYPLVLSGCVSDNAYTIYCFILTMVPMMTNSLSFQALFTATLERYVKICHPFRYHKISNKTVQFSMLTYNFVISILFPMSMLISADWSSSMDCGDILMSSTNIGSMVTAVYVSIQMMIMFHFNVSILRIARKQRNQIHSLEVHNANGNGNTVKGADLLGIMMLFMFLCYAPIIIVYIINAVTEQETQIINNFAQAAISAQILNNCVNPVLFVWKDRKIRKAMKAILCGENTPVKIIFNN